MNHANVVGSYKKWSDLDLLLLDVTFQDLTPIAFDPTNGLNLSSTHDLAVYDSAYLTIAAEQQVVLWTMDQALKKAAKKLGVAVSP